MTTARKTATKKTSPEVEASQNEAAEKPTPFEYKGESYEVPHPLDWPLEAYQTADEIEVIALVLGEEQWARFTATGPTLRDFNGLMDTMTEAQGRGAGSGN
ncbi:hypothetical protein [Streptomyces sp. NPDC057363]|uniref:hypothetical protein n=1 Tax=Streptomyces sp. NPDC057363 TaxID=3346107 RepID=UPI003643DFE7